MNIYDNNSQSKSQVPVLIEQDIQTLTNEFISSQDIRESSKESYSKYLKVFLLWIRQQNIKQIREEDIIDYKEHLKERELSPFTISEYMVVVRKLFEWTERKGLYPNIARGIKGAKKPQGFQREYLILNQFKELLESIQIDTLQGLRDYAMINLMVRTGLRDIEVKRIDIKDIQPKGDKIVLYIQGKGSDAKDEFVILKTATYKPIQAYLSARGIYKDIDPLFISLSNRNKGQRLTTKSISRVVKGRLRDINIDSKRLTAHSLRHTAITFSLLGGASIQEAQSLARHKNINTTLLYAHNIDRLKGIPEEKIDQYIEGNNEAQCQ